MKEKMLGIHVIRKSSKFVWRVVVVNRYQQMKKRSHVSRNSVDAKILALRVVMVNEKLNPQNG